MKKLLLSALTAAVGLATLAPAAAQTTFTNSNLETWETRNGVEAPANWLTTDDIVRALSPIAFQTGTVTKTTDAHGGNFAARLESKAIPLVGVVPGVLVLGQDLGPDPQALNTNGNGVPFTGRPAELQFYYKLTGASAATDSASVVVQLAKSIDGQSESVADTVLVLTPSAEYRLVRLPLNYYLPDAPDTLRLAFLSGQAVDLLGLSGSGIHAGTALQIDDISFMGVATPTRAALAATGGLTVFPNPSAGGTFTLHAPDPALTAAAYTVFDATGRVVARAAAATPAPGATRTIDLHEQRAGLYTLLLQTARGPLSQKLVIQ